jgi:hypothetical protein
VGDRGQLFGYRLQPVLDLIDPHLDLSDLLAGIGEEGTEEVRQVCVGVFEDGVDGGDSRCERPWG